MKRKHKPKKKPFRPSPLTQEQETFVASLIGDYKNADPAETVAKLPDSSHALILAERLPLDDESSIPLLMALKEGFENKEVRRAVKRAVFKLKKRGIPLGEAYSEKAETPAILKPPQLEKPEASAGPIDMSGFRAVLMTFQRTMKGVDLGLGVVSDEHGIQHFLFGTFSKKRVKELKDSMLEEAGPFVEISPLHAATLFEHAYQRHLELGLDVPPEYLELRPWLLDNTSLLDRPPIYDVMPEESAPEETLTNSRLERLFEHDLMRSWYIEFDSLKPFMEDVQKIDDSPIVLTEIQKLEQATKIKEKYMEGLFTPAARKRLKHRLEEMAYLFYKLGEEEALKLSLAAARSMDQEDTILRKNPVIEFLLQRSLNFYGNMIKETGENQDREKGSSSRIILP